ncbi:MULTISPECIES: hypothetical protein [unclassified Eisenbergiella]|nr:MULTISPECIES: hypothetical protein [unclassified Eisenbergiella]
MVSRNEPLTLLFGRRLDGNQLTDEMLTKRAAERTAARTQEA